MGRSIPKGYWWVFRVDKTKTVAHALDIFRGKYYEPTRIAIGKGVEYKTVKGIKLVDIQCPDGCVKIK